MARTKLIAGRGVGLTWTAAFAAATLANANSIAGNVIDNSVALDVFCDLSLFSGSNVNTASPAYCSLYIYPLNQDGTTYGDGRFGTATGLPAPTSYWIGNLGTGREAPNTNWSAVLRKVIMPPDKFKFVVWNFTGGTLATGNIYYRTYNRSVA